MNGRNGDKTKSGQKVKGNEREVGRFRERSGGGGKKGKKEKGRGRRGKARERGRGGGELCTVTAADK